MIRFICPVCGKVLKAPEGKGGAGATCPSCGLHLVVPSSSSSPPVRIVVKPAPPAPPGDAFDVPELELESEPAERTPAEKKPTEKYCHECGAVIRTKAVVCPHCGVAQPPSEERRQESSRVAAGICGILLGSLGIHKFVLGLTMPGVIMLLLTLLTCGYGGLIMGIIGLVEGIIYLTKSEKDFHQDYIINKQGWF